LIECQSGCHVTHSYVAVFSHKGTLLHDDSMATSITGLRVICDVDDKAEETVDYQNVICETEGEAAETDESRAYRRLSGGIK